MPARVERNRSVVFDAPAEGDRFWLTEEDKATYPAERCPPVVSFDAERRAKTSFGFLHHKVKYDLLTYVELPDDVHAAEAAVSDAAFTVEQARVLESKGKVYLRLHLTLDGQGEGVHDTRISITANGTDYLINAHSQVLHDHQGHPALHAGVRPLTSLLDAATDAGSEWPGHGNDHHETPDA